MADKKISALPAATTPLAGTEVLPIVQGGTTDQVSVANLTSGRFINMDSATVGSTSSAAYGSKLRVDGGVETFSAQFNIASGSSTPYEFVLRSSGAGFDFYVNAASKRSVRFLSSGDVSLTDNLVVGTAGKGIDFSANTHAAGMVSELLDWYERGNWTPAAGANLTVSGSFTSSGRYVRVGKQVTVTGVLTGSTSVAVNAGGQMCTGLPFVSGVDSVGTATNGSVNASTGIFTPAGVGSILSTDTVGATGSIIFTMSYIVD